MIFLLCMNKQQAKYQYSTFVISKGDRILNWKQMTKIQNGENEERKYRHGSTKLITLSIMILFGLKLIKHN